MSQELMCKWEDFDLNASRVFKEIQARSDFCDVKIGCSDADETVKAHRVILASFSNVFEEMFQQLGGNSPVHTTALFLRGVTFEDLTSILDFIYQGEVSVAEERMPSFLAAAEDLKIIGLYKGSSSNERPRRVERIERPENIRRNNSSHLKREREREASVDNMNRNKYSKVLKQELLQNLERRGRNERESAAVMDEMNEEDEFDPSYENFFEPSQHQSNIKLDPDSFRIKNEVVMEPIDTSGILDTLDANENDLEMEGFGQQYGMQQNSVSTTADSSKDASAIDKNLHPIGYKTDTNGNKINKQMGFQARCKVCGKQDRKDKIKRHLIDKHFPNLKAPQAPLSDSEDGPGNIPPNFDKNDIEFFDSVGHWDPTWGPMIQQQPILPYQWIIANAKSWLEYLPNQAAMEKSKFRCRICYNYGSVAQTQGEGKNWNVFSPLIQEVGDLKSSSENNRNMLRNHAKSDFHMYVFDCIDVKRKEARQEKEARQA